MDRPSLKIYEALRWASSFLTENGYEQPIAEILLKHYLRVDRTTLFQMFQDDLSIEIEQKLKKALTEVIKGVPVQHITGVEEFYGRTFLVNKNVLIPRPETEELVEGLLKRMKRHFSDQKSIKVIEVGTGSGAIAITLALEDQKLNVTTIDISSSALEVAKKNAQQLNANIRFLEGDLLAPIMNEKKTVNVIISNPPYISDADFEILAENVRDHEPRLALVGGATGYEFYERLLSQIPTIMTEKGMIGFEVGDGQSKQVEKLIKTHFERAKTEIELDINGKERMVFATLF